MVRRLLTLFCLCLLACKPMAPLPPSVLDDEFLYWCIEEGRWPVYGELPEKCENVSRGEWDHLPITVNAEEPLRDEVMIAIEAFNNQVGFEMFRYQTLNLDPDIGVIEVSSLVPWAAAEARHYGDTKHSGLVVVQPAVALMDRDDIMLHELGHMVGLRHDLGNYGSIMYAGPAPRSAALEFNDVVALRRRYRHLMQ